MNDKEAYEIIDQLVSENPEHYSKLAETFAKEEEQRKYNNNAYMNSLFRSRRPDDRPK